MPLPSITITQQFTVSVSPTDRKGNPAEVEAGTVNWESSDPAVVRVEEDPENEFGALVIAQGVGSATVSVTADADLGEGAEMIFGSDTVEVTAGRAASFSLQAGEVEEQP